MNSTAAGPRITLGHAQALAEKAVGLGLAARGRDGIYVLGGALRAALLGAGATTLGQLTASQAADLERFLEARATALACEPAVGLLCAAERVRLAARTHDGARLRQGSIIR